jgi:hypothetical protein
MFTLIEYPVGVVVEAVVLSRGLHRLRVAVPGLSDALELIECGQDWITEDGQKVAIGFLQADVCEAEAVFPHQPALVFRAAGSWAI